MFIGPVESPRLAPGRPVFPGICRKSLLRDGDNVNEVTSVDPEVLGGPVAAMVGRSGNPCPSGAVRTGSAGTFAEFLDEE